MKSTWLRVVALLFAFTLIAAACGDDEEEQPVASGEADDGAAADDADGEAAEMVDIVDTAVASGQFPTLVAALEAADLVDTLKGEGPFTVFAPTEEAFANALEALGVTAEELLANPDLASILTYHVVSGNVPAADVVGLDGEEVATVNGATVTIGVDGETVTVNDATVVTTDIMASNGVIHVIDTVLLPPAG
jgi:uncharacterized surface protein with fasciclin (FAS1) repeats